MVTWENYEEFMMLYADGELGMDEERALMAFVAQDPKLQKELDLWCRAHITPDPTQIFEGKEVIQQEEPRKRAIILPVWTRYSIAAAVAALIVVSAYKFTTGGDIANNGTNGVAVVQKKDADTAHSELVMTIPQPHDTMTATMRRVIHHSAPVVKAVARVEKAADRIPVQPHVPDVTTRQIDAIGMVNPASVKEMALAKRQDVAASVQVPQYETQASDEAHELTFWDKLPIADRNKEQLKDLAGAVADKYGVVNDIKESISDKSFAVKVERRRITISF